MIQKFQSLEVGGRKSSKPWKFFAVLFPMLGSLAFAQGPGSISQGGFFQAWWGAIAADPYERLLPTAYWYPSRDLNNTDRILGIASTNTVNVANVSAVNGWEFNGTSQYLDMGRPTGIEPGTNLQYSMAAWVYGFSSNTAHRGIMGKSISAGGDRWSLFALATGFRTLVDENGAASDHGTVAYGSNIWYHVVMTLNRASASNHLLYVDGVLRATGTFTDPDPITFNDGPNTPFMFGSYPASLGARDRLWNGYMDRAAVWNGRALTSNEVFNLFQDTRSGRK
jgi:hypothetical protein